MIHSAEGFCEAMPKEIKQLERNKGGGRNAFLLGTFYATMHF